MIKLYPTFTKLFIKSLMSGRLHTNTLMKRSMTYFKPTKNISDGKIPQKTYQTDREVSKYITDILKHKSKKKFTKELISCQQKQPIPEDQTLKFLLRSFSEYIHDACYVYKRCSNNVIIVLQKTNETITNEEKLSDIADPRYAKFRGNKFRIVTMIDLSNFDTPKQAKSIYDPNYVYTSGQTAEVHNFDQTSNVCCAPGIHYYKDLQGTYYDDFLPKNHSGEWVSYHDNGQLCGYCVCLNGKKNGFAVELHDNGKINFECNYANDKLDGRFLEWYRSENLEADYYYKNGIVDGKFIEYYENGQVRWEGTFVNGNLEGTCVTYYRNGKVTERNYKNGILIC